MPKLTEERIAKAVDDATEAFWNSICASFPPGEVPSGDLPTDILDEHNRVSEKIVLKWIEWNHPEVKDTVSL